jgi:hypothetical protein
VSGTRQALLFATSSYDYEDQFQPLAAPMTDAEVLRSVLSDQSLGRFDVQIVGDATASDTREKLEKVLADCQGDDFVLVHFACHGFKAAASGELYLAARDTTRQRPETTGIAANTLLRMMRDSRARNIVLILDCCYSGAFSRGAFPRGSDDVDLEQLLADTGLKESSGRAVITASSSTQQAFEVPGLAPGIKTSVFTQALVKGIRTGDADTDKNNRITLSELYHYVLREVRTARGDQTPSISLYDVQGDPVIAWTPQKYGSFIDRMINLPTPDILDRPRARPPGAPASGELVDSAQAMPDPMPFLRDAARLVRTAAGNPLGKVGVMAVAAVMAVQWGELDQARRWLQETMWLQPTISDPAERAVAQAAWAWALGECGDREAADDQANRARGTLSRMATDDEQATPALARLLLGWVTCRSGSEDSDARLIDAMAEAAESLSDPGSRSLCLVGLAWMCYLTGSVERSRIVRLLEQAADTRDGEGDSDRIVSLLLGAWVAGQVSEHEKARELLTEVQRYASRVEIPAFRCMLLSIAAVVAARVGDPALAGQLRRAASGVRGVKGLRGRSIAAALRMYDAASGLESKDDRRWPLALLARRWAAVEKALLHKNVKMALEMMQTPALLARAWAAAAGSDRPSAARMIARAANRIRASMDGGSRLLMLGIVAFVAFTVGDSYQVTELLNESDRLAEEAALMQRSHLYQELPSIWLRAQRGSGPAVAAVFAAAVAGAVSTASKDPEKNFDSDYLTFCAGVAWLAIWTGGRDQAVELLTVIEDATARLGDDVIGNITVLAVAAWGAAQAGDRERALRLAERLAKLASGEDGAADLADDDGLLWRGVGLIAAAWIVGAGERPPYAELVRLLRVILPAGPESDSLTTLRDSWAALFERVVLGRSS